MTRIDTSSDSEFRWPVPQAAYVHVPFCRHHCGYCNFSVLAGRDDYGDAFLEALDREFQSLGSPREVSSIFIGGGTPTHLNADWIDRLLRQVTTWFRLLPGGEFSVEANPNDINQTKLGILKQAGVNRVSLGVQSFDATKLSSLERDHDGMSAIQAINLAAEHIKNMSIDLIFAVPGESLEIWHGDLKTAYSLPIKHISTYGLTYEKGARFWSQMTRGVIQSADEELELAMYCESIQAAESQKWRHYEVSNFAEPGYECKHNMAYWEGRGWYAFGPGAARFCDGARSVNHRSPTTYIRKLLGGESAIAESEAISRETWARERLVFGLRMLAGVDIELVEREAAFSLREVCGTEITSLVRDGWLIQTGNYLRLSKSGLMVSDSVLSKLL